MTIIATQADLPLNPLWSTMDAFIQSAGGSTRTEVLAFLKQIDDGGQVFLFGYNLVGMYDGERLVTFRRSVDRTVPPIGTLLANAASAAGRTVRAAVKRERVLAAPDVVAARQATCNACVHLENGTCMDVRSHDGTVAKGCGCRVQMKAQLANETCPQSFWK